MQVTQGPLRSTFIASFGCFVLLQWKRERFAISLPGHGF